MSIRELFTRTLVTIDAAATPAEAARLMRRHHVGALVVTRDSGDGRSVAGLVTDRDLVIEALAAGPADAPAQVGAFASAPPVAVPETADLAQALASMQAQGVRRLLVVAADGHLAGLLSLDDVLPALARLMAPLAEVAQAGAAREASRRPAVAAPLLPRVRVPAVGTAGWQHR